MIFQLKLIVKFSECQDQHHLKVSLQMTLIDRIVSQEIELKASCILTQITITKKFKMTRTRFKKDKINIASTLVKLANTYKITWKI